MPGSFWQADPESGRLQLLNRPSWLLGHLGHFHTFMSTLYTDTGWLASIPESVPPGLLTAEISPDWPPHHKAIAELLLHNTLATVAWVNSRAVCQYIEYLYLAS